RELLLAVLRFLGRMHLAVKDEGIKNIARLSVAIVCGGPRAFSAWIIGRFLSTWRRPLRSRGSRPLGGFPGCRFIRAGCVHRRTRRGGCRGLPGKLRIGFDEIGRASSRGRVEGWVGGGG